MELRFKISYLITFFHKHFKYFRTRIIVLEVNEIPTESTIVQPFVSISQNQQLTRISYHFAYIFINVFLQNILLAK
jgi:hypothetical protein